MNMSNWYVYILQCADSSLYTGVTTDIERRVYEHNHSKLAAAYTRARRPVKVVYSETQLDRATACKREAEIKSLSRQEKQTLITQANNVLITPINDTQKSQVKNLTQKYIRQACQLFSYKFDSVDVVFDLKGRAAGMYKVKHHERVIRYNPWLFAKYYEESLANTVPHEVAHYIVDCLYGRQRTRPHGKEWQKVMQSFGVECRVTGNYDLTGIPVRKNRTFNYQCKCRTHEVSSIRHKRIQRGADYRCRQCHTPIQAVA